MKKSVWWHKKGKFWCWVLYHSDLSQMVGKSSCKKEVKSMTSCGMKIENYGLNSTDAK